jgi:tetratricopeptide (TPR) repeat protein
MGTFKRHFSVITIAVLLATVPAHPQASKDALHTITTLIQAQQYKDALQRIQGELQNSPNDARLWTLQGMGRSGLGNDSGAIISFRHALKLDQDYLPALQGAAQIEYSAGNNRAIPLLEHILRLQPTNETAHAMLAALAYKQGDCQSAAEHFSRAAGLISSQAAALEEYAACLAALKRLDQAIPVLEKLVALKPADRQVRMNLATIQLNDQHAKDVIETLRPLVESAPPDPDALELLSAAYEAVEDTPRAVEALRKAIVLAPRNVDYYLDFADLSFTHSSFQVGVDMVSAGLKLLPNSAPLHVARGVLLIQMARYAEGESDFEIAQRIDPNQASGSEAKALAEIEHSNPDRALQTVRSQLREKPNDAFLYYLLAEILSRYGEGAGTPRIEEAIQAAKHAVQLNPELALAHDILARLYLKSHRPNLAIEESRLTLRIDPADETAVYHLIMALRQSGQAGQIPLLLKRYAELREQTAKKEARRRRFQLFEPDRSSAGPADTR